MVKPTESLEARNTKRFKIFCNTIWGLINRVNVTNPAVFPNKSNPKWKGTAIWNETSDETCYHKRLIGWFGDWISFNH